MKVLVLHSELGVLRGGGENFTRNLFSAVARRGHKVAAVFVADPAGRYPLALPLGIEPIPLRGWWSRKLGQRGFLFLGSRLPCGARIKATWDRVQEAICWRTIRWHDHRFQRRVMRDFGNRWREFDIVYVHGNVNLASQVALYRPTILRLPGPVTGELETVLRQVHVVCANGDALRKIRSFLGDHAIELPIGIDASLFKPGPTRIRSSLGWSDEHYVLGYVGRFNYLKGTDLLALAFRNLSRTVPNARLLMVGQGEAEQGVRSILAAELAQGIAYIKPDVEHEQLAHWYRAMDLFVMPSRYENFSNALLEALSCGVPVLASDIGGNGLLADDSIGLFQVNSVSSLSMSLQNTMQNVSVVRAQTMIRSRDISNKYSWEASAERLESVIFSRFRLER